MISIITVVRNGVSTIEKTILSVLNQDYPAIEYIVIDGVSTDGTLAILDKYADRIAIIKSEPDQGIYDAMNKGIALATGEWVYFLGCDDVLYANSTLSAVFSGSSCSDYDAVYGSVLLLQSNKIYDGEFNHEKLANRSICHQAIIYKKHLFQQYGTFNTKYITAADYVFNAKAFNDKWLYVDEVIAIFNETGISQSRDLKSRDDSFAIRYDNFRPHVSSYILSRIFWSSYFRYVISHPVSDSMKYIGMIRKDIGFFTLLLNFPKIMYAKIIK